MRLNRSKQNRQSVRHKSGFIHRIQMRIFLEKIHNKTQTNFGVASVNVLALKCQTHTMTRFFFLSLGSTYNQNQNNVSYKVIVSLYVSYTIRIGRAVVSVSCCFKFIIEKCVNDAGPP